MPQYHKLVSEYRGEILDLVHFGYLAAVDENSRVLRHVGDADTTVFYRSAAKPLQGIPVIARGLGRKFGFTDEETALFSGSHCGDPVHVTALESMADKAGFREDMLVMKPAVPARHESDEARIRAGLPARKFYHNCAGKHVALMLLQRELAGVTEDYWKLDAPAQLEVRRAVQIMGESSDREMGIGVDGCGVPVFATSLRHIAIAFKNLAAPDRINDEALGEAAGAYVPLLHKYPYMIRGEGYLCTILNRDPNIVAKGGANGVYGFALKKERIGVAVKLLDGTETVLPLIVMEALRSLGALSPETEERLSALHPSEILNDNGTLVGRRELVGFRG